MFYIRGRSLQQGHAGAFVGHLLQTGSDVHMGMVENAGYGKATTFLGATPNVDKMVQGVADHFHISVVELMDFYVDIAEGFEGITTRQRALIKAISSYKPE
jgi:hypothetical protein